MEHEDIPIDVEATAQAIDNAAATALGLADKLQRAAASMREKQDITYATEVVLAVTNAIPNFRLELMVARPLREYELKTRK